MLTHKLNTVIFFTPKKKTKMYMSNEFETNEFDYFNYDDRIHSDENIDQPTKKMKKNWYPGMRDTTPPFKNSKEIPEGSENCLTKNNKPLAFVITGTLDSLEREECENLITKYGGRFTSAVSGKTDYLIQGNDEDGNKFEGGKVNKAKTKLSSTCQIINEDAFIDLIRKSTT